MRAQYLEVVANRFVFIELSSDAEGSANVANQLFRNPPSYIGTLLIIRRL